MSSRSEFGGINEGYILELYERFRENPESVDPATRAAFERAAPSFEAEPGPLRGTRPTYPLGSDSRRADSAQRIRRTSGSIVATFDPRCLDHLVFPASATLVLIVIF